MAAGELNRAQPGSAGSWLASSPRACELQPAGACLLALAIATCTAAVAADIWPALAPATRPHPTLDPSPGAVTAILVHNARVLAAPFVLIAARFQTALAGRVAGDLIVAAILAGNATAVGLALGRWGTSLLPYLPHLPLEYAACACAGGAWIDARRASGAGTSPTGRAIVVRAIVALGLLFTAAAVEVLLTPHAR